MKKQAVIFTICYCAYISIYVARQNLSLAAPALKQLDILSTAQIGIIGGVFFVVYACGRLFSSRLSDRFPPYIMISLGLVLCGASNLLCGSLPAFELFLVLWGINAVAQSMLWGSILRVLSAIHPVEEAKRKASYMGSAVAAGNVAGIIVSSAAIQKLGAAWAFMIPGAIAAIMSLPVIFCTKAITVSKADTDNADSTKPAIRNKDLKNMLIPAVIHGVMKDNISLWMAVYVLERFGMQLEQSTAYMLLIPILGFVGRILAPSLYQMCGKNEMVLTAHSFLACAAITGLLIFMPGSAWFAIGCLSLVYMAVSVINACMLAIFPIRFTKENQVASVSGILDFATYLGTGISSMFFGVLIQKLGYDAMFTSWAVLSCLSFVFLYRYNSKKQMI